MFIYCPQFIIILQINLNFFCFSLAKNAHHFSLFSSIFIRIFVYCHNLLHLLLRPFDNIWCVGGHTDLVSEHFMKSGLRPTLLLHLHEPFFDHFVS